jgi:hypothetical protein
MSAPIPVYLRWLNPEEGGRPGRPIGPEYRTTAELDGGNTAFDVVLNWREADLAPGQREHVAGLTLPDAEQLPQLAARLTPGARLEVRAGPRRVAVCQVLASKAWPKARR